jgi:hypothetical protein
MSAFRFSLEKALEWRRKQLELEEARYKQRVAALAALDTARAALAAASGRAQTEVRQWSKVIGRDLAALDSFRLGIRKKEGEIDLRRVECLREVDAQQTRMLEARRRARLLERLKERRRVEWQSGEDRELENLASESFLAQWSRRPE